MVPRLPGHVDEDFEVEFSESGIFIFKENKKPPGVGVICVKST